MRQKLDKVVFGAQMKLKEVLTRKKDGIDGLLVTVGLCIIALLLCVVMKDELATFIKTLVGNMTNKANGILGV